jgi:hypothetical protein
MTIRDYSNKTGRPNTTLYLAAKRIYPDRFKKGRSADFTREELIQIEKFLPEKNTTKRCDNTIIPDSFWIDPTPDSFKEDGE